MIPSPSAALQDWAPGLEGLFSRPAEEASYRVSEIKGQLPVWLRGTHYANGPASFRAGEIPYRHWLDGDGMIAALRFDDDGVSFRSRFVATRKRRDEQQAGRAIYRTFGTAFPGDALRRNLMLEPPVNVSVLPYAGSLLALGEQSLPMDLDPLTLETRGPFDFHGALNEVSPFAAHARIDPANGHLVNFGVAYSSARTTLSVYEFDAGGRKVARKRVILDAPYTLHDMALTQRFAIFHLGPLLMDLATLLDGGTLQDSLRFQPERGAKLLIVPRERKGEARQADVGDGYCLHFINAFEEQDALFVDLIEYERPLYGEYHPLPNLFQDVSSGVPVRWRMDADGVSTSRQTLDAYRLAPDFPAIDPAWCGSRTAQFWCLGMSAAGRPGRKFFNQLVRLDWSGGEPDIFQLSAGEYFGAEPAFAPGPDGAGGVVIVQCFRPARASACYCVFNAQNIGSGPLAEIPLQSRICPSFHTAFAAPQRARKPQDVAVP